MESDEVGETIGVSNKNITLRFAGCTHVVSLAPLHNSADDHAHCFVCHPELQKIPLRGVCPTCATASYERQKTDSF